MYCSSCGSEVNQELNYCNRCGANLNMQPNPPEQPVLIVNMNGSIWAIAFMVVVGLGITFGSISGLARNNVHPAALTWMVIGGLGMLLGVVALFLRQMSHMSGTSQKTERPAKRQKTATNERYAPQELPPMRTEPVPSVTEHTTRTFEPVVKGKR